MNFKSIGLYLPLQPAHLLQPIHSACSARFAPDFVAKNSPSRNVYNHQIFGLLGCNLKVSGAFKPIFNAKLAKGLKTLRQSKNCLAPAPLGFLVEYLPNGCELWNEKGVA